MKGNKKHTLLSLIETFIYFGYIYQIGNFC